MQIPLQQCYHAGHAIVRLSHLPTLVENIGTMKERGLWALTSHHITRFPVSRILPSLVCFFLPMFPAQWHPRRTSGVTSIRLFPQGS